MKSVKVEITRFVDEDQPGFVECVLIDAEGRRHTFIEKSPIVSSANLWSNSGYPQAGSIACEVREVWKHPEGRVLVRVSTEEPWGVESTEGLTTFVLSSSQMTDA